MIVGVDPAADGVEQLRAVHAEMDTPHAQPVRPHGSGNRQKGERVVGCRLACQLVNLFDDVDKRNQAVGMVGGQRICSRAQLVRVICRRDKQGRHGAAMLFRPLQSLCDASGSGDRVQRARIAAQPLSLFDQPMPDAGRPTNVGPAIHIIANPCGEAEGNGGKCAPMIGPMPCGDRQNGARHIAPRHMRTVHGIEHLAMFPRQCDGRTLRIDNAHGGANRILISRQRDRIRLRTGQQKGRMSGKDDMLEWPCPPCGKGRKITALCACFDKRGERGDIGVRVHRAQQGIEPVCAALQRLTPQFFHQRCHPGQREVPAFHIA